MSERGRIACKYQSLFCGTVSWSAFLTQRTLFISLDIPCFFLQEVWNRSRISRFFLLKSACRIKLRLSELQNQWFWCRNYTRCSAGLCIFSCLPNHLEKNSSWFLSRAPVWSESFFSDLWQKWCVSASRQDFPCRCRWMPFQIFRSFQKWESGHYQHFSKICVFLWLKKAELHILRRYPQQEFPDKVWFHIQRVGSKLPCRNCEDISNISDLSKWISDSFSERTKFSSKK